MELNTALQKLKEYERRSFALSHASGLMYYDGHFAAYQQLCSEADSVWHEAKVKDDFSMFEPYLQKIPHLFFSRRWFISVDIIPSVDKSTAY